MFKLKNSWNCSTLGCQKVFKIKQNIQNHRHVSGTFSRQWYLKEHVVKNVIKFL